MKASELMIGDWVYQALYKDAEIPNKGHGWKEVRVTCLPFDEDWAIAPIPLTEKILKANGWICCDGWFERNNVDFFIAKCGYKYKLCPIFHMRSFTTIAYVHELQRVLRCCGLNELADNFRVV